MVDTCALGAHILGYVGSSPTWGTMKKIIIQYKNFILKVHADKNNTHIQNSYLIKSTKDMRNILKAIQSEIGDDDYAIFKRSICSMIHEWRVHNLLYSLGIEQDRTKSVDLDINQPWYMKVSYPILSIFYFHF